MLQKIQSNLLLTVKNSDGSDVDFSKATNILFGLRQRPSLYLEYPGVWVDGQLLVAIPLFNGSYGVNISGGGITIGGNQAERVFEGGQAYKVLLIG